jgi:chitodextrinase
MFVRSTVWAAGALTLALVFTAAAPAARGGRDRHPPTTPTNLRITATGPTSISLAWDASTDNQSNWWYCVQRNGSGCVRVDPPNTTHTRNNLMPNTTHSFSVYAIDAAGNRSGNSNVVTYTTPPDTTPPSPTPVLSAAPVHPVRTTVRWTAATDNTSQVWYTLLRDGEIVFQDAIGLNFWPSLDLTPETTYVFTVRARDAHGNSVESAPLSVTTPAVDDIVPPSTPTNLTLDFRTNQEEIWFSWTQSTDNVDPQSEILYEVYLNGVRRDWAAGGWTIVYCNPVGEPNTVTLRAVDTDGNRSDFSDPIVGPCS